MNEKDTAQRRLLLKAIGGTALLPLAGTLAACSGEQAPPAEPEAPAAPEPAAAPPQSATDEAPAPEAPPAEPAAMPALSEDDPQARALAYVEDATTVDSAKYPRYESGQNCSNCALYVPRQGAARGGCSIFPGKSVNANGWCNVYAAKT